MRKPLFLAATALALTMPAGLSAQATENDGMSSSAETPDLSYPETRRGDVVEAQFGVDVADPYRWLENDVREDDEVAKWVQAENAVTDAYLDTLDGRDQLAQRMKQLFDYERFGVPTEKGGHYFYTRNDGLQNQAVLYVRDDVDGEGRVLIDPNQWSADGATALAEWVPSDDGAHLLYGIQDGGTDWRTVRVLDVVTGEPIGDELKWIKFSNLDWSKDGEGFIYSRFPEPAEGATFQALNENQAVYYHALGTPQSADTLLYATPDEPKLNHTAEITDDGRYALVTSSSGTDSRYRLNLIDLTADTPNPRAIVPELQNDWRLLGLVEDKLYFATNKDAPLLRIVTMPVTGTEADIAEIVPEGESVIDGASIVGGKLVLNYLVDAKNAVMIADLDGANMHALELPGIGAVGGFGGDIDQDETFFAFSSFTQPGAIYRLDMASETGSIWEAPELAFDPDDYVTEQRFYASKDGTEIPMFIVRRKDVTGAAPTLLYGYGGFDISLTPGFSPTRMAWIDEGGVFAQANLRGGGEYGKAWHDGGRLLNKQNVFDDFIAAGEYLKAEGITGENQLAVEGRSNGGLLIGAVVNQRPDLFAAGHAAVGVMDMLRFDRFTAGRYWVDDYGYPDKEADFRNLLTYSPYHNIGTVEADYPAVIVSTADTDDRVVPGHSFKYISALQQADTGPMPKIIRIETRAGHGSGKPTDKLIEEYADIYAFLARWTGLNLTGE